MKKIFVLDASAFIAGFKPLSEECYTLSEVVAELKSEARLKTGLSLQEGSLRLIEPEERHIEKVKRVAQGSGDTARLSETDIKLLACALRLKEEGAVAIVTDDYSVQNVAKLLDIEFASTTERGIKKIFRWHKVCRGCGKNFLASYSGACDVCGSEVRIRKKV